MAEFNNSLGLDYLSEIPTLQQVSDVGNTTTTTVHLDGGALSDSINEQSLFGPNFVSSVNKNTGSGTQIDSLGFVSMSPNGIDTGIFAAEYVVGEVTLQFPNKPTGTYTIATTADIPAPTVIGFEQNFLLMGA